MDAITKLLVDPGWWVTAVFVGIIVSVTAGFLKDWISKRLESSSNSYRAWRQRKRASFLEEADKLSRDMGFILYARIQAVGLLVLWALMVIIMLAAYIISKQSIASSNLSIIGLIASGILSFVPYFRAIHFVLLAYEAKRIYIEQNFPDEPKA